MILIVIWVQLVIAVLAEEDLNVGGESTLDVVDQYFLRALVEVLPPSSPEKGLKFLHPGLYT